MSLRKLKSTAVAPTPNAIDLIVTKAATKDGEPQKYYVRGQIGPLRVTQIAVTETKYKGRDGAERDGYDVQTPYEIQEGTKNPHNGEPYRRHKFKATEKAKKDFNKVVRDAVHAFRGMEVYEPITTWPHSLSSLNVVRMGFNKNAFSEDEAVATEASRKFVSAATIEFAGFLIEGVYLKELPDMKKVTAEDGTVQMVPVQIEETPENGEFPTFATSFPSRAYTDKSGAKRYSNYINPVDKATNVIIRDGLVQATMQRYELENK